MIECIRFTSMRCVFVRFLEEIEDTKKPFEITWPLQLSRFVGRKRFLAFSRQLVKQETDIGKNFDNKSRQLSGA